MFNCPRMGSSLAALAVAVAASPGMADGAGPSPGPLAPSEHAQVVHAKESRSLRVGEGAVRLEPGARVVGFEPGFADGFLGAYAGSLTVEDGPVSVVLPTGVVSAPAGAGFELAFSADGHLRARANGRGVTYQGDGGGGGRAPDGGWIVGDPSGRYRVASSAPGSAAKRNVLHAPDLIQLTALVESRHRKRSLKLEAWEKKQAALTTTESASASPRATERLHELRARSAVTRAWSSLIIESYQGLEEEGAAAWRRRLEALRTR